MRLPRHLKGRLGFTTGACATAALKGALAFLKGQRLWEVSIELPIGRKASFKLHRLRGDHAFAQASVIKDAGDDPDVTHEAEIEASVFLNPGEGKIIFRAGEGVGVVTKPGLGLPLYEPAITKVPRRMMSKVIEELLGEELQRLNVEVVLSIPHGEQLAQKTLNPRLGIKGGLSILGTKGVVIPFSTAAYKATIAKSLLVAKALGIREVILSTGGRSEGFAHRVFAWFPEEALIQMGDFVGFSLRLLRIMGFERAILGMMIGKLAKLACGFSNTHAQHGDIPLSLLQEVLRGLNPPLEIWEAALQIHTARGFLELLKAHIPQLLSPFCQILCDQAAQRAKALAGGSLLIEVVLFDFEGQILARSKA